MERYKNVEVVCRYCQRTFIYARPVPHQGPNKSICADCLEKQAERHKELLREAYKRKRAEEQAELIAARRKAKEEVKLSSYDKIKLLMREKKISYGKASALLYAEKLKRERSKNL